MTRRSKRELEKKLEQLTDHDDDWDDIELVSRVVTVTRGEDGLEYSEPEPAPPEGYERGQEFVVASSVVDWHALVPTDAGDGEETD